VVVKAASSVMTREDSVVTRVDSAAKAASSAARAAREDSAVLATSTERVARTRKPSLVHPVALSASIRVGAGT
jgi:hypothetical protein